MKKFIFVLTFSCVYLLSYSQENNNIVSEEFTGIGIFEINKSNSDVIEKIRNDISTNNYTSKIENITDEESLFSRIRRKANGDGVKLKNHYCPHLVIWKISKYFIGDIELNNIELSFYKDILFKFKCIELGI